MITRRDVMKWGAVGTAVATGTGAAFAKGAEGLDAFLLDEGYAADMPVGESAGKVLRFHGDVTKVWFDTLDPAWRRRGFVLGGITGSDTLFVLENLARQQGRRVVSQTVLGEKDARGVAPVSWIIAPVHPSVMA